MKNTSKLSHIEIERKWLVNYKDIPFDLKKYKFIDIVQYYILKNPSIRIRKFGKDYYFCIKTKTNNEYSRNEIEFKISKKSYNYLLKKRESGIISKRRYYIPYENKIIELDIFKKVLKGLCYAEIEFDSIKECKSFKACYWFKKEVTKLSKYSNMSLAYQVIKNNGAKYEI